MESNQPIYPYDSGARAAQRCRASMPNWGVKARNAGDGLIWPTEGRFSAPAEHRCGLLAANQAAAHTAPRIQNCQRTQKAGQMTSYSFKGL